MLGKAGGPLLLLCVGLSHQICHNGICDLDRCASDDDCPTCYSCDVKCGVCNAIDNCCQSHHVCPDWNGICDLEENPTTCNYCNFVDHECKPGCIDNGNCETGSECHEHQCKPITKCTDDAYCNAGLTNICDIENSPYTTCFYCENGECLPGCVKDSNCPSGYTCDTAEHLCQAPQGKVLIESITVNTKTGCADCSSEGVTLSILGEKNGNYLDGVPCSTKILDHAASVDYDGSNGSWARFDGKVNGAVDKAEKEMMGGCYEAPLNAQMNGGTVVWQGADGWEPASVCVDWQSSNFAYECSVTKTGQNTWNLVNCHDLTPKTKCNQAYGH